MNDERNDPGVPRHLNPHGVVHGGVAYSLVDYAMGGALTSRLAPGERCATLEIRINYLAAATAGPLAALAPVVDRTSRIGVLEARVTDGAGRLVALATGSFYIQAPRAQPVRPRTFGPGKLGICLMPMVGGPP